MAVELGVGVVSIIPSARGFGAKLGKELGAPLASAGRDAGQKASKEFGGRFTGGLKGIASTAAGVLGGGLLLGGVAALSHGLKDFVDQARDSAKIGRLSEAVLKSTGGVANISAGQVGNLATKLSNLSGVDDELIQSSENVLLTFTKVRNEAGRGNDVFNQASTAALNMSAALGTDLQGATLQLGKALNDPIKGITALSRAGVSFTAQQKEQIKTLVASGDVLGAQKLILKELNGEFGGAAQAAADPLQKLSVIAGNFKEQLGGALLPVINKVASGLGSVLPKLGGALAGAITPVLPVLADLVGELVKGLAPVLPDIGQAFAELVRAVVPLLPPLAKLAVLLVREIGIPTLVALAKAFAGLATALTPLLENTKLMTPLLIGLVGAFAAVKGVRALQAGILGVAKVGGTAVGTLQRLAGNASKFFNVVKGGANIVGKGASAMLNFGKAALTASLNLAKQAAGKFFTVVKGGIGLVGKGASAILDFGKAALTGALNIAKQTVAFIAQKAAALATAVATKAMAAAQWLLNVAMDANPVVLIVAGIAALAAGVVLAYQHFKPFRDIVDAVGRAFRAAFNWVKDHWPLILGILTGPFGLAVGLIKGNWERITGFAKGAFNWVKNNWPLLLAIITAPIGIAVLAISKNWKTIKEGFGAVKRFIGDRIGDIVGFFTGLPGKITTATKGLFHGIAEAFKSAVNFVIRGWNSLQFKIGGFKLPFPPHTKFPDFKFGVPPIPELAGGGVITSPTVAFLGENSRARPEIAAPARMIHEIVAEEIRAALKGLSGGGVSVKQEISMRHDVATPAELEYSGRKLAWAVSNTGRRP